MRIKHIILILMSGIIVVSSLVFTYISYNAQSKAFFDGLDRELLAVVYSSRKLLGDDFHDKIENSDSLSEKEFYKIVETYNEICRKLELEYIWSLLQTDEGEIVFTSSTATSKDITKGDYGKFFELHSDPHLYTRVFETMEPQYQVSDDKWGRIRAVLVPYTDKHGRSYLFGASIKMARVDEIIKNTLLKSLAMGLMVMSVGIILSLVVARYISRPIEKITIYAKNVAKGNLTETITASGSIEMKSLAGSITNMNSSLKSQLKKVQFSNKELREIFYISSHDLKYPLMKIESSLAGLKKKCDEVCAVKNPQVSALFGDVVCGLEQLKVHLDGMLNISRISSLDINEAVIDMNQLIDEVSRSFGLYLQDCGGRLTAKKLPECAADQRLLYNVLSNLIDNSIKYRSPDRELQIEITGEIQDSMAVYCVKDNGIGIHEDFHENVFEIFRRVNRDQNSESHGLGLTIVVRIIERLDGQIWLESEPDKGSSFYVALPLPGTKGQI